MNGSQWLSLFLLIGRLIAVCFIVFTTRLQWKLIVINNDPSLQWYRKTLFALGFVLLANNFIPVVIDVFGVFGRGSLGLLYAYVISNNISAILASFITWFVYYYSRKR